MFILVINEIAICDQLRDLKIEKKNFKFKKLSDKLKSACKIAVSCTLSHGGQILLHYFDYMAFARLST